MTTARLAPDEIKALKFAAHRQLARYAKKPSFDPRQHTQRTALVRAVRKLDNDAFCRGCELRAADPG